MDLTNSSAYDAPFTVWAINNVPRFGHATDLAEVINTRATPLIADYSKGTIFIGVFILAVFILWMLITLLLLFCGKKGGVLSGQRLRQSSHAPCRQKTYRSIVMFCSVASLLAGMIFFVKVSSSLQDGFDLIKDGADDVAGLANEVSVIASDVIVAGEDTIPIRDAAIEILNEGLCNSMEEGNGNTIQDWDEEAKLVVDLLTQLSDFTRGELTNLKENFDSELYRVQEEVDLAVETAENYGLVSYYSIAIIVLSTFLSLGAYMATFGPKVRTYFMVQKWLVLPLYFLILIFTAIVVAVLSSVIVVNSDLCMGGDYKNPESFVKAIVDAQNLDEYTTQIFDFYVFNSCQGDFIGYDAVDKLSNELKDGNQAVSDLRLLLDQNQAQWEQICGGAEGSLDGLKSNLGAVNLSFSSFIDVTDKCRDLIECSNINDIYTNLFHQGVCTELPNTQFWMLTTMILVLVFGMLLFTFRSALTPTLEDDEPEDYYYSKNTELKTQGQDVPDDDGFGDNPALAAGAAGAIVGGAVIGGTLLDDDLSRDIDNDDDELETSVEGGTKGDEDEEGEEDLSFVNPEMCGVEIAPC